MSATNDRRIAFRRREDIYRKAVEDLRDYAIFLTDPDGVVISWNAGAQYILGYREEDIVGKNASKFFTAEDRARNVPNKELTCAATLGRAEDERWHVRQNGSRFWASGVVTPVYDHDGKLLAFIKVMRDMTERNKLTEERDRFFTLSMDMLSIVHLDGRLQRVNPMFQEVLGYSEEELLTKSLFDLVHPDDRPSTESAYEQLKKGQPIQFMENRLACKDQEYKWVAWSYFPVPEDGLAFGVGRDTTELRKMQEALRERATELEDANRVKDEFLATMSHELRTPLTSILGWSRLLASNELGAQEKARAVQVIQRNAEAQSKLIEDLLDVSRIITGKLKIESQPLWFAPITETVINSLRPAVDAKDLHLEVMIDPSAGPILGDPARLQQIVTNLLSNAIKFTSNGGHISIRLERSDSRVRLIVRDTGIGIAPDHLPHIFERFRQVDSSTVRAHGGLGLGLAIVDYLVRQQEGIVCAESEGLGKGTCFTVEFPLMSSEITRSDLNAVSRVPKDARGCPETSETVPHPQLQQRRILLVEDDLDTQELLETILARHGAEVMAVDSASAALAELGRVKPDVIISDVGMVGENGYDLIRKIRSLPPEEGGRIPAIALTAYAAAADRRQALLAGFQTHLAKPVDPDDLLAVVYSLTFQQEAHSEEH